MFFIYFWVIREDCVSCWVVVVLRCISAELLWSVDIDHHVVVIACNSLFVVGRCGCGLLGLFSVWGYLSFLDFWFYEYFRNLVNDSNVLCHLLFVLLGFRSLDWVMSLCLLGLVSLILLVSSITSAFLFLCLCSVLLSYLFHCIPH